MFPKHISLHYAAEKELRKKVLNPWQQDFLHFAPGNSILSIPIATATMRSLHLSLEDMRYKRESFFTRTLPPLSSQNHYQSNAKQCNSEVSRPELSEADIFENLSYGLILILNPDKVKASKNDNSEGSVGSKLSYEHVFLLILIWLQKNKEWKTLRI